MRLTALAAIAVGAATLVIQPTFAETRTESVLGTVTRVDVLTSNIIRKTPTDEKVCNVQDVPVYEKKSGGDDIGGLIVGGLIGSAIGNKLSDSNGAGAAGAVAGALLGREASKNKGNGEIVGYRREEVCEIKRVILEEKIERIDGYRLEVEVDNRIITLESKREYEKGQRVEIAKRTTYGLQ